MLDITKARQLSNLEHLEKDVLELNSRNEGPFKEVLLCYLKGVEVLFPKNEMLYSAGKKYPVI
ncbi:hypothetical protein [Pedobacter steynii]